MSSTFRFSRCHAFGAALPFVASVLVMAPAQAQSEITIAIDGRVVAAKPAPVLRGGSVFVPLRGPLEQLGAVVAYDPTTRAIRIARKETRVTLNLGSPNAISGTDVIPLASAPILIRGSAFVPLRSLAELFGFGVEWNNPKRQVRISTAPRPTTDHRALLQKAGTFGVTVDFADAQPDDVAALLDAVKRSGAKIVKTRFDWNTLEPSRGAAFQFALYDRIVRGARERGLTVVGVLGVSATWASRFYGRSTTDPTDLLFGPPSEKNLPNWSNYVSRVVGRYKNDVQAWQVWEAPGSLNFRGPSKLYRVLTSAAASAARRADANAVVFAAEPGGVNLQFLNDLAQNGSTGLVDGVAVYPTSQLQPGALAPQLQFVRAVETVRDRVLNTGRAKNLWIGGLSQPVVELVAGSYTPGVLTNDPVVLTRLQNTFTPQAQADYLVRAAATSLASGAEKAFYARLRDPSSYARADPLNSETGAGLLKRDNSERPSFAALQTLAAQANRPFAGVLSAGPDIIALLFDDGDTASVVAWSLTGPKRLVFNLTGTDPQIVNSLYVSTRSDTQVLSSTGQVLAQTAGEVPLTDSPVWITNVGFETRNLAKASEENKRLVPVVAGAGYRGADAVSVEFGREDGERGLSFRQFVNLRGAANDVRTVDGRVGLATQAQRDITNPNDGRPYIFLDVADDFLFFERGVPVTVTVEVKRPQALGGITNTAARFSLEYSTPRGVNIGPDTVVEPGDDFATFTFELPDAAFSNPNGYDLLINTLASRQDLIFTSITVRRATPSS